MENGTLNKCIKVSPKVVGYLIIYILFGKFFDNEGFIC